MNRDPFARARLDNRRIILEWQSPSSENFYAVLSAVKELPDRKPHLKTLPKYWSVPASPFHAAEVVRVLTPLEFEIEPGILEMAEKSKRLTRLNRKHYSQRMVEGLRPYQVAALDFIDATEGRAMIGDDVGLGKSVEALVWAWCNRNAIQRVLIVSPANVVYKWGEKEVPQWTGWDCQVLDTSKAALDIDKEVHVMSYDILRRRVQDILQVDYDLIILDEFHYIKNPKSQRTRSAQMVAMGIPYILLLSGTPIPNRPVELFTGLHLLDPKAWPDLYGPNGFGYKYCGGMDEEGRLFGGSSNEVELARRLQSIMIRRLKRDVRRQLPPLSRVIVPVDVPLGEYRQVYRNVKDAILSMSPKSKGYWTNVLDRMNLLRQAIGHAKAEAAVEWSEDFLDGNRPEVKLLIYAHHLNVVQQLVRALGKYGVLWIDGAVSPKQRHDRCVRFQSTPDERVMVITQAGSMGEDMFGLEGYDISNVLFAEQEWRPMDEEQVEGRLDRDGQPLAVTAWYLTARETIDDDIAELKEAKRTTAKQIVGGPDVPTIVEELVRRWRND